MPTPGSIADKDRFPARENFEWQMSRPMTYFWEPLAYSLRDEGISGLRREVLVFLKGKCRDAGVYCEFVNCLTHLARSVQDGRRIALIEKGYDEPSAARKAQEWPLCRSVRHVWEVVHQMWRIYPERRAWHIKLSKLEKQWD